VSGTVAAQNFAALLAPRIMGSRSGMTAAARPRNFGASSGASSGGGGGGGGGGMGGRVP